MPAPGNSPNARPNQAETLSDAKFEGDQSSVALIPFGMLTTGSLGIVVALTLFGLSFAPGWSSSLLLSGVAAGLSLALIASGLWLGMSPKAGPTHSPLRNGVRFFAQPLTATQPTRRRYGKSLRSTGLIFRGP